MKKLVRNIILPILFATPINTFAAYSCIGDIDKLTVAKAGHVQVRSTPIYGDDSGRSVCVIDAKWKDVSVSACKAWLVTLIDSGSRSINSGSGRWIYLFNAFGLDKCKLSSRGSASRLIEI